MFRRFLDLQYFNSDNGGEFGGGSLWEQSDQPNPLLATDTDFEDYFGGEDQTPEPQTSQEPEQQEPTVEELDFGGRKVQVADPAIRDLHKDWSELNKTYQSTNQRLQELERMNQQLSQSLELVGQGQQPNGQQNLQDNQGNLSEEFMERFYEDPMSAINSLVEERLKPITQEREFNQSIQSMTEKYDDFRDYTSQMEEVIRENPAIADMPNGLDYVYQIAKGRNAQQAPKPQDMLSDPQFRDQIMQNEEIRNQILQSYAQNKQQTNRQTPSVMGNQPGSGQAPSTPPNRPRSLQEASRAFMRSLGQ